jgi:hypothetical protein
LVRHHNRWMRELGFHAQSPRQASVAQSLDGKSRLAGACVSNGPRVIGSPGAGKGWPTSAVNILADVMPATARRDLAQRPTPFCLERRARSAYFYPRRGVTGPRHSQDGWPSKTCHRSQREGTDMACC